MISGLTPGATYQVNVHFWDGGTTNAWSIRAGYASNPGANTHYVAAGDRVTFPDATEGMRARSLNYHAGPSLFVEADRTAYAASMGPSVADDSGQIVVYIDDLPNLTGDPATRTWYDGVSYALIAPPRCRPPRNSDRHRFPRPRVSRSQNQCPRKSRLPRHRPASRRPPTPLPPVVQQPNPRRRKMATP